MLWTVVDLFSNAKTFDETPEGRWGANNSLTRNDTTTI